MIQNQINNQNLNLDLDPGVMMKMKIGVIVNHKNRVDIKVQKIKIVLTMSPIIVKNIKARPVQNTYQMKLMKIK